MTRPGLHIVRPMPIELMAQATRDAGMQAVVEERRIDLHRALAANERRLRKPPSFFATLAADAREFLAMPTARAGRATPRTALRRFVHSATIAIAVFCVVYFGLQLLRGVL